MDKIQNTTGGRISLLLNEKGELQKEFCANLKIHEGVKVSEQTVCSWINNKSTPRIETLKKIAHYFNVDYRYLTCERDYKNFEDMKKKAYDIELLQTTALYNFLEAHGYYLKKTDYYYNYGNYFKGESNKDIECASDIFEVTTPNNEKYYLNDERLQSLVADFFSLLDTRLIQKEVAATWDL